MRNFKIIALKMTITLFLVSAAPIGQALAQQDPVKERETLEELRNDNLSYYKELMDLRKRHPQTYKKVILGEIKKLQFMTEMRESNPEVYKKLLKVTELENKVNDLAKLYSAAENNERKAELKNEIKNLLSELFELKEEKYNIELNELENQIKTLKSKISKRKENKEKIIGKRLENLMSSDETLEW